MAAPIRLRADFDAARLRALAKRSHDPDQTRRLLALAVIYEGGSRMDAARIGAVGLQTVRDWVLRFNAEGPEGLLTGKAPGARPLLTPEQRQALAHRRRGANPCCSRGGALALGGSGPVGLGGVPDHDLPADAQP